MLFDVGEHIPHAKKEKSEQSTSRTQRKQTSSEAITLKVLWKEPDWRAMYIDGFSKQVLAYVYSIYHSLAKKPLDIACGQFEGEFVTSGDWEDAYEETILFIKKGCENATTIECIESLKTAFNETFNRNGKSSYKTYAAGKKTPRMFFHPLGKNDKAGEYRKLLPYLDWPLNVDARKIPVVPIELVHRTTKAISYSLGKRNKRSVSWYDNHEGYTNEFKTYEEAVKALVKFHGEAFSVKRKEEDQAPLYIPVKKLVHINAGADGLTNKKPIEVMKEFGFRGIQFGNYLPQKERQVYINNIQHSLTLLARILKIPNEWMGARKLGLAIGARGHGYASAHYELDYHVINLTRFNGAGSIAHEVFHAFDARMALRFCGSKGLLSSLIMSGSVRLENVENDCKSRFLAFKELLEVCCDPKSNFVKNAQNIGGQKRAGSYWSKPEELMARAFESWVEDKLRAVDITDQWLAQGTLEKDYPIDKGMHPYPIGREREAVYKSFELAIPRIFTRTK